MNEDLIKTVRLIGTAASSSFSSLPFSHLPPPPPRLVSEIEHRASCRWDKPSTTERCCFERAGWWIIEQQTRLSFLPLYTLSYTYTTIIYIHIWTNIHTQLFYMKQNRKKNVEKNLKTKTIEELVGKLRIDLRLNGSSQFQIELMRKDGCHTVYAPSHRNTAMHFWVTHIHVTYILWRKQALSRGMGGGLENQSGVHLTGKLEVRRQWYNLHHTERKRYRQKLMLKLRFTPKDKEERTNSERTSHNDPECDNTQEEPSSNSSRKTNQNKAQRWERHKTEKWVRNQPRPCLPVTRDKKRLLSNVLNPPSSDKANPQRWLCKVSRTLYQRMGPQQGHLVI